ncbi:MAG: peptide deformylase [Pseudomonadota bacterium]
MAVKQIIRMGNPILLKKALPVTEFNTRALDQLIQDMFDTMAAYNGVGLAAPQIAVSQRLVVFGVNHSERYPNAEPVPQTILINPQIEFLTDEVEYSWEGCLSIPGMRGLVPRCTRIRYSGYDQHGKPIDREVSGFHAVVVQHEVDHLDGMLYPRRIKDLRDFGFTDELFNTAQG